MKRCLAAVVACLTLVGAGWIAFLPRLAPSASRPVVMTADTADARIAENYSWIPLAFEVNRGQSDAEVKFLARGAGYNIFLTSTEAVLALHRSSAPPQRPTSAGVQTETPLGNETPAIVRMQLVGANRSAPIRGHDLLPATASYLTGNDPRQWRTGVPMYRRVQYSDVYRGIDMVYYGNQRQLEHDFVVAPGARPDQILVRYSGAQELRLDMNGDLVLQVGSADVRQKRPFAYQDDGGTRREVPSRYILRDPETVGFEIGEYDAEKPLIIDPVLVYSTYLGGIGVEGANSLAVSVSGEAYVGGSTWTVDFPTLNALQPDFGGVQDMFVAKLTADGSALIFSTYFGGNGHEHGRIAVDASGAVYLGGRSTSTDFPTTPGAWLTSGPGAFVAKLSSDGSALIYSTFVLSGLEGLESIAVDGQGFVYGATSTRSPDLPTRNAVQPNISGGLDAFVVKLNQDGSDLLYATYLGGSGHDVGDAIAVDASGSAFVVGMTLSTDFPTVNAVQPGFAGGVDWGDCWVAKLPPAGTPLAFSTYLGGAAEEISCRVAVDPAGFAHIVGTTYSSDYPTHAAVQPQRSGPADVLVTKLTQDGAGFVYSTFLGGSWLEQGEAIAVDNAGQVYVTGLTASTDFPTAAPIQPTLGDDPIPIGAGDVFLTKLNASGAGLIYSTYLGGSSQEIGYAVAADMAGSAYVAGVTSSDDFPTANAVQPSIAGGLDAFLSNVSDPSCPPNITAQTEVQTSDDFPFLVPELRLQFVLLRNTSTRPVPGPLAFVLDQVRNGFVLSPLVTRCMSSRGSQFVLVGTGPDGIFSPGEYALGIVFFVKTAEPDITYTPYVLAGVPTR